MEISVFNLNCWLLPRPLSADSKERLSAIADLILEREPEIITLQEVWPKSHVAYLKKRLDQYHCTSSGSRLYNQSGLVTFSKAKPLAVRVGFYKLSRGHNVTELVARKGYLEVDLHLHGEALTVINTHLYAAFSKKAERIVEKQLTEVISRAAALHKVLLCGDLNLGTEKFGKINNGRLVSLCDSQNTVDDSNPYSRRKVNAVVKGIAHGKLDYITQSGGAFSHSEYQVINTPFVSDHYPIYCRVTLS